MRWEKIRVQDLLDRTGISRSTFYAHYDNKLDIITSDIPDLVRDLALGPDTSGLNLAGMFEHANEMASIFGPLLSQSVLGDISAALERVFADAFERLVDGDASPALPEFLAGAMIATIRRYVTNRDRPPPERVATEIEGYLNTLLPQRR